MRVVIADPPAYTPVVRPRARSGARACRRGRRARDVALPLRGAARRPTGYRRVERFYPLSSRLFRRSRARLPLKAVEHLGVAASLARLRADVVHVQWLALPQVDVRVRCAAPSVFTAHDLLPRRTADKRDALARAARAVRPRRRAHRARPRDALRELGIEPVVISHPVYPSKAERADDGQTILALGVIRPYKGLADAIEVTRRLPDARLLVAGDPAMPLGELARRAAHRVAARVPDAGRARPRALGRDGRDLPLPGRARPVRRAAAGARRRRARGRLRRRRARRADRALRRRARRAGRGRRGADRGGRASCSPTRRRSQAPARAPSGPARELTWDAAAAAHLELYRELRDLPPRPLRRRDHAAARHVRARSPLRDRGGERAARRLQPGRPRRGRGALRRLRRRRSRPAPRSSPTSATPMRG